MRVSIIIPSVNRPRELDRLLLSLAAQTVAPREIIIVNQGGNIADKLDERYNLPLTVIYVAPPSLTRARNAGVLAATGEIIGFLDDDCVVETDYVEAIENFFSAYPTAKGVQGVITNFTEGQAQKAGSKKLYPAYNVLAKFFLLNNFGQKNKLLLSGRNRYAARVDSVISCEWLSGVGNYRREIFSEFHFDESLGGYALGEDKLFSYPIQERYPRSLFADPNIRLAHYHASFGRPEGQPWVEMKVRNTRYVWQTLLKKKGLPAAVAFWWANLGDLLVAFCAAIAGKRPLLFGWWHLKAYFSLLWNRQ